MCLFWSVVTMFLLLAAGGMLVLVAPGVVAIAGLVFERNTQGRWRTFFNRVRDLRYHRDWTDWNLEWTTEPVATENGFRLAVRIEPKVLMFPLGFRLECSGRATAIEARLWSADGQAKTVRTISFFPFDEMAEINLWSSTVALGDVFELSLTADTEIEVYRVLRAF